jgi:hypothetical protein
MLMEGGIEYLADLRWIAPFRRSQQVMDRPFALRSTALPVRDGGPERRPADEPVFARERILHVAQARRGGRLRLQLDLRVRFLG